MNKERNKIFAQMVNYFTEDEWRFSQIGNKSKLLVEYKNGQGYEWKCIAEAEDGITIGRMIFYSIVPESIPIRRDNVNYVGEFLHRINSSYIKIGNFEIDYDTGRVYCKTSIKIDPDLFSSEVINDLIDDLVYENIGLMDRYLDGIKAVAEGKLDPEEAQIRGRVGYS